MSFSCSGKGNHKLTQGIRCVNSIETSIENEERSVELGQGIVVLADAVLVEAAKDDFVQGGWIGLEEGERFPRGYAAGLLEGETVDTATDGGEGDCPQAVFDREGEACLIAGGEELGFAVVAVVPYGTHRVDDVFRRQAVTFGDLGLARFATAEGHAFFQQGGAGGSMDGAVDAASAEQGFVGGVYDGVHLEACEVTLGDGDFIADRFHYVLAFSEGLQEREVFFFNLSFFKPSWV